LLFDGDLEIEADDGKRHTAPGQVELQLYPKPKLLAHVFGPAVVSAAFFSGEGSNEPKFSVPNGADLKPPDDSVLAKRDAPSRGEFYAGHLQAGDLSLASHLVFHLSGALEALASPRQLDGRGRQPQLDFALPGWELVLVPGTTTPKCEDFAAIVQAIPTSPPISIADVDRLHRWLFILFGFLANREIGIGPACGLDAQGEVVWAEWGAPRLKMGKPGVNWCPPLLVGTALPELATGLALVSADRDLEVIIDRAIGYSLAANGDEVIEVRIPIVCSGLELLAWALLQREGWLADGDARRKIGTAASVRLLLKWAGIPTAVPSSLPNLEARLRRSGQPAWEGPEILFNLRNSMVHPPKRLNDPEWPDAEDLVDAWQLGTWYLELALLRVFEYDGEYWSRIRLGRPAGDLEPVPWASDE
jgi:hypothetical protein